MLNITTYPELVSLFDEIYSMALADPHKQKHEFISRLCGSHKEKYNLAEDIWIMMVCLRNVVNISNEDRDIYIGYINEGLEDINKYLAEQKELNVRGDSTKNWTDKLRNSIVQNNCIIL